MNSVLIIGGTQFIGRHTTEELLSQGYEVTLLNRGTLNIPFSRPVTTLVADRKNKGELQQALQGHTFDAVVDMIGYLPEDVQLLLDVLDYPLQRYVLISTASVYKMPWVPPTREDAPLEDNPQTNAYGYNKVLCEEVIRKAHAHKGLAGVILRLPAVYGEYDPQCREWYVVKRLYDNRPHMALADGDLGIVHRIYAKDVARAISLCLKADTHVLGQSYNIGHTHAHPAVELTRMICQQLQKDLELVSIPATLLPWGNPHAFAQPMLLDLSKARNELGFTAHYSVLEGLQRTLAWLDSHRPTEWRLAPMYKEDPFNYQLEDCLIGKVKALYQ